MPKKRTRYQQLPTDYVSGIWPTPEMVAAKLVWVKDSYAYGHDVQPCLVRYEKRIIFLDFDPRYVAVMLQKCLATLQFKPHRRAPSGKQVYQLTGIRKDGVEVRVCSSEVGWFGQKSFRPEFLNPNDGGLVHETDLRTFIEGVVVVEKSLPSAGTPQWTPTKEKPATG